MQTKNNSVEIVSDQSRQIARTEKIIAEIEKSSIVDFTLALGATALSDLEGISAAGASASTRRLTPKLDAEALLTGRTASGEPLPSSPAGITSPVVITRACLSLVKHRINIVDCGTFVPPDIEHVGLGCLPGNNIAEANSMDIAQVRELYRQGRKMALERFSTSGQNKSGKSKSEVESEDRFAGESEVEYKDTGACEDKGEGCLPVIAECVPGGTTTALAVLKALGIAADSLLSSSIPGKRLGQAQVVATALRRLEGELGEGKLQALCAEDPLLAVSYLGDPMQAFVAGFALGALEAINTMESLAATPARPKRPKAVVLAGGSQMLALYALVRALAKSGHADFAKNSTAAPVDLVDQCLIVITTKWVAHDPFGNTQYLAKMIGAPFVSARMDFSRSRHAGLRAYEDGHVKEGVGAGATLVLAKLLGNQGIGHTGSMVASSEKGTILSTIDDFYDKMVLAD
jgi:NaMN:DMB phosphoribosyltransferase